MDELAGPSATAALLLALASAGVPAGAAGQERPAGADEAARGGEVSIEGIFVEGTHESPHGSRRYRLFVPDGIEAPSALLLMLHGCTQGPADVARGTRLNEVAAEHGWLVLYPEQPPDAHPQRCWNWYLEAHQKPGEGEPALLASLVESVAAERPVDRDRTFVAGISAGGAMALVMGAAYPERFAAVASHSGVPYGAGRDTESALAVTEGGGAPVAELARRLRATLDGEPPPPLLLIHGTEDPAVALANAYRAAAAWWLAGRDAPSVRPEREASSAEALRELLPTPAVATTGVSDGGLRWSRRSWRGPDGVPELELWRVEGLGHAWSGGDPAGSYTDPAGPDATRILADFLGRVTGDRHGVDGLGAGDGGPE